MRPAVRQLRRVALVALLLLGSAAGAHAQGYKVVVNATNPTTKLSKKEVAALFLKKVDKWSSGAAAQPVDLAEGQSAREAFTRQVLGKSPAAVRAYWNQMVFSGRNVPPAEKPSDAEVLAYVKSTPGAIGYVSANADVKDVKVVAVE
jgi:ABC-type phosphate transport system substrate-binding protein